MRRLLPFAAALLASCVSSNWHLMDSGYAISALDSGDVAVEVHVNQLQQLGGEVRGAQFRQFVTERLKWHGLCPDGWALAPCAEDGSCIQRTRRSVTVPGRCVST